MDTAAQLYRVDAFRRSGFSLWDSQWYGGHWTLGYSVLYPALAASIGVLTVAVASAAVAALAFDACARPLGPGGVAASYLFAAGTLVQASIGQLPFLTGEAFGVAAVWALSRRRHAPAAALALLSTLSSPLAGAFVALAAVAWLAPHLRDAERRARVAAAGTVVVAALAPVGASMLLFPGEGPMPYPVIDWVWEMVVAAAVGILAGRRHRAVRAGAGLLMVTATVSVLVPSALGGNVGRIEDVLALPLAVAFLWSRARLLVPLAAVPLAMSQWAPAGDAFAAGAAAASTHASYYAPLDAELERLDPGGRSGRVEVVPTAYHWEADYVAPVVPLARGWERQLDVADDPIFYERGALTATAYRSWLVDNGVRFVALPDAPLDMAGKAEAALVSSETVPGLDPVWRSAHWRLYAVAGSPGIVSGPARLVSAAGGRVVLDAPRAGTVVVRVRYSPDWTIDAGAGCVRRSGGSWLAVEVPRPEQVTLGLSLFGAGRSCPSTGGPAGIIAGAKVAAPGG